MKETMSAARAPIANHIDTNAGPRASIKTIMTIRDSHTIHINSSIKNYLSPV